MLKNNSLISVIVPVYNTKAYLGKCIKTIIDQSYKNLEIILIDDGSTDGTSVMCDESICYALIVNFNVIRFILIKSELKSRK